MLEVKFGEVLICVCVVGVNWFDVFQCMGNYLVLLGVFDILGFEVVGEIVSGDLVYVDNCYGLKVGDCVCVLV